MMKRICKLSVCLLLLNLPTFARCQTAVSRTGDDYTLSNRYVEAVFGAGKVFGIKKLVLNGRSVAPEGRTTGRGRSSTKARRARIPSCCPNTLFTRESGYATMPGPKRLSSRGS